MSSLSTSLKERTCHEGMAKNRFVDMKRDAVDDCDITSASCIAGGKTFAAKSTERLWLLKSETAFHTLRVPKNYLGQDCSTFSP